MHIHTNARQNLHENTFSAPANSEVFLGLTDWLHMQQHVLRVSSTSSKQIANRTDRKYVLFSRSSGLESLAGLFKVFPQSLDVFKTEKIYIFAAYLFPKCNSLFTRDKTLSLSHRRRTKVSPFCWEINWTNSASRDFNFRLKPCCADHWGKPYIFCPSVIITMHMWSFWLGLSMLFDDYQLNKKSGNHIIILNQTLNICALYTLSIPSAMFIW